MFIDLFVNIGRREEIYFCVFMETYQPTEERDHSLQILDANIWQCEKDLRTALSASRGPSFLEKCISGIVAKVMKKDSSVSLDKTDVIGSLSVEEAQKKLDKAKEAKERVLKRWTEEDKKQADTPAPKPVWDSSGVQVVGQKNEDE